MNETGRLNRCLIVGGGAVGLMFADLLTESDADVLVADIRQCQRTPQFVNDDIVHPGGELIAEMRAADMVMLAVPEGVALAAAPGVLRAMRRDALFVHVLSVQSRMAALLHAQTAQSTAPPETIGLNPMFGPAAGIAGRAVIAVGQRTGPRAAELVRLLSHWGARVVPTGADRHDRLTATAQALTHAAVLAFGLALERSSADISELIAIAPPPHLAMLALLARITTGTPEVYWDVQAANPYAANARENLRASLLELEEAIAGGEPFAGALARAGDPLGARCHGLASVCGQMFGQLRDGGS